MVRRLVLIVLVGLLTACSGVGVEPNRELVQKAIALQMQQTQQQLQQQVRDLDIKHIKIAQKQPISIQDLPGYRVQGTYDLKIKLPKQQLTQPKNPFEVYLQRQKEGKTWRLALPQFSPNGVSSWFTYLIP
ncbi:hypothetical protein [Aliterella atlantica]|uniref:Lipoprotein n=1 Tax=Aliterella atlantica CENA595 TaxID=1618023 RepID=A0A0D8ZS22_9CYAN|nr:hypothetical protein [Aliterella atlantica]KJH70006.1 hypothetical protein UH38_20460 [Aliterella atlantica CENA595]